MPGGHDDESSDMGEASVTGMLADYLDEGRLDIDFSKMVSISSGGQGVIYLTKAYYPDPHDTSLIPKMLSCQVALKELLHHSPTAFATHLELTQQLESTRRFNLIKLIGVVTYQRHQYAVLPYCETFLHKEIDNFHHLLTSDPMAHAAMVTSMMCHILNALKYMHERNHVHRDVKPANIAFCARHGMFALADIDSASPTGVPAEMQGTIEFMHPRMLHHSAEMLDFYNDIYALGKTALFLLDPAEFEAAEAEKKRFKEFEPYLYYRGSQFRPCVESAQSPEQLVMPTFHDAAGIQAHLRVIVERMMSHDVRCIPTASDLKLHFEQLLRCIVSVDQMYPSSSGELRDRTSLFVKRSLLIKSSTRANAAVCVGAPVGAAAAAAAESVPTDGDPFETASSFGFAPPPPADATISLAPRPTAARTLLQGPCFFAAGSVARASQGATSLPLCLGNDTRNV